MATLTQSQIEVYALAAGFTNPRLMAAIAMAESSGRTDIVNSIGCVGLWQINQPVWVHEHPTWTQAWLKDPVHNAMAAKVVYDIQGLTAWETYTNGAYKKFYSGSSVTQASDITDIPGKVIKGIEGLPGKAVGSIPGVSGAVKTVEDVGDSVASIAKGVWSAGKWLSTPYNWVRIAFVVGGSVLTVVAIDLVIQGTLVKKVLGGGSASDAAVSLIPGGSMVKKKLSAQSQANAKGRQQTAKLTQKRQAEMRKAAAPAKKAPAKKAAAKKTASSNPSNGSTT